MVTSRWFVNEDAFRDWAVGQLTAQHWHAQVHREDDRYPGIPDLSIGGNYGLDLWAECKTPQQIFQVGELMKLKHPLSSQQFAWLQSRSQHKKDNCGILLPYRIGTSGFEDECETYVSFVPVRRWREFMSIPLRAWVLAPFTANLRWLIAGPDEGGGCSWREMLCGKLTPGWRSRHTSTTTDGV